MHKLQFFVFIAILALAIGATACPEMQFYAVSSCEDCPAGSYCDGNDKYDCPEGTYNAFVNQTTCTLCAKGHYCEGTGLSSQTICPSGYQHLEGQNSCSETPIGFYSPSVFSAPSICEPGYYTSAANQTSCTACEAGSFCVEGSKTDCPAGYYTPVDGRSSCSACPAGKYCMEVGTDTPVACASGSYSLGGAAWCETTPTGYFSPTSDVMPLPCAPGTYQGSENSTSCSSCPAGKYCPGTTTTPTNCAKGYYSPGGLAQCEIAPANTYVPVEGMSAPALCPDGQYSSAGSEECTDCESGMVCPAGPGQSGFFCPGGFVPNANKSACTACGAGDYSMPGDTSCTPASEGYYTPGGLGYQIICPVGHKCTGTGNDSPTMCTSGEYQLEEGQAACAACTAGFYCPTPYEGPSVCPDGYYTSGGSQTSCTVCEAGSYCYGGDMNDCHAGFYSDKTGMSACKVCPKGAYCYGTGLTSFTDCPSGSYTVARGAEYCETTPSGFYLPRPNSNPIPCPSGTYQSSENQTTCAACPAQYYCMGATTTPIDCPIGSYCPAFSAVPIPCPPGTECPSSLMDSPTACGSNEYCVEYGCTSCESCPVDMYCPNKAGLPEQCPQGLDCGTGLPEVCAAGTFSNDSSCSVCEDGFYQPSTGQSSCLECPAGSKCPDKDSAPVQCADGFYSNAGAMTCTVCSAGTYCPAGATTEQACDPGYYSLGNVATCTICPAGSRCPDMDTSPTPCLAGEKSSAGATACTGCSSGYYNTASGQSSCTICPAGSKCPVASDPAIQCSAGTYSSAGATTCLDCTAGYECPTGASAELICSTGTYSASTSGSCSDCPLGKFCNATGLATPYDCPAGYYASATGLTECTICPAGSQCLNPTTSPTQCVSGYYSAAGATSCTQCSAGTRCPAGSTAELPCSAGEYSAAGAGTCTTCQAGKECPNLDGTGITTCSSGSYSVAGETVCTSCPAGVACPSTSTNTENPCPSGFYSLDGEASCTECTQGYECSNAAVNPVLCAAGSYSSAGSIVCEACSSGYYQASSGMHFCSQCPSGSKCPDKDVAPETCPAGTYSAAGAITCEDCSTGYYSAADAASCTMCPAGYECPTAASSPVGCLAGYYSLGGQQNCTICPAGYECSLPSVAPTLCAHGTYSPGGVSACLACTNGFICEVGETQAEPTGKECAAGGYCNPPSHWTACPAGTYNPNTGGSSSAACIECEEGHYCVSGTVSISGANECPAGHYCPAGTANPSTCGVFSGMGYYSPNQGNINQADCTICPAGSYCPAGATSISSCPTGHYCLEGTYSATQYPCPAGYYNGASNRVELNDCIICPAGRYCAQGTSSPSLCPAGRFRTGTGGVATTSCTLCTAGKVCSTTGLINPDEECDEGHYCPEGTSVIDAYPCPAGTFTSRTNLTDQTECTICPAGFACSGGNGYISNPPQPCVSGHYCPAGTTDTEENNCPGGSYSPNAMNEAVGDCTPCPGGSHCIGGQATISGPCTAGYYCPESTTNGNDNACPAGTYSSATDLTASSACTDCPEGSYCPMASTAPIDCPAGSYSNSTNTESIGPGSYPACQLCPAGYRCPLNTVDPIECGVGYYSDDGATSCIDCPQGKYCPSNSTTLDDITNTYLCPAGKYCDLNTDHVPTVGENSCPIGKYCVEATVLPTDCPAGRYTNVTGKTSALDCLECPPGYYCLLGSEEVTGECDTGYYCPSGSTGPTQIPCPSGSFRNITKGEEESFCAICNLGYYCPEATSDPLNCPRGYYCPTGTSIPEPCPLGTYGNATNLGFVEECTACPGGYYCDGLGQPNPTGKCEPGYYCSTRAYTSAPPDDESGGICPPGGYCPLGSAQSVSCPAGTYNNVSGARSEVDCFSCDPGYYCSGTRNPYPTGPCYAGYYCTGGASTPLQNPVGVGQYSVNGSSSPLDCAIGTYNDMTQQGECFPCTEGFYCPNTTMTVPVDCPDGNYCPEGSVAPTRCPRGMFTPNTNLRSVDECETCSPGLYCPTMGMTTDGTNCAAGYYCNGSAEVDEPTDDSGYGGACTTGHYCPEGTSSPVPCPIGTYNPTTHAVDNTSCVECTPGMYCENTGLTAPDGNCTAGFYCVQGAVTAEPSGVDNSTGAPCPVGFYCPERTISPLPCSAGTYTDTTAQFECTLCTAGFYCPLSKPDTEGQIPQEECPAGSYCPAGTFTPLGCPDGTYQPSTAKDSCITCPAGKYCQNNATTPTDCPLGDYCELGSEIPTPCPGGTYGPTGNLTQEAECYQCPAGQFCAGGDIVGNCTAGYICNGGSNTSIPDGSLSMGSPCPMGYYCPAGTDIPITCPILTWTLTNGASQVSECVICTAGQVCNGSAPFDCPRGSYCPHNELPKVCPITTYNPDYNMSSLGDCITCPAGYICNETMTDDYTTYSCPIGFYCEAGSFEPVACPTGSYRADLRGESIYDCDPCPAGSYCPDLNTTIPTECPDGMYCPENTTSPILCPIGYIYNPDAALKDSLDNACLICPPGYACDAADRLTKTICEAGFICVEGAITTTPTNATSQGGYVCPVGYYCESGDVTPTPCAPGYFNSLTQQGNSSSCTACAAGSYSYWYGKSGCLPCGPSAYSSEAAKTCQCVGANRAFQISDRSCICEPGYQFYDSNGVAQTDADSIIDCQPIVYDRCDDGQFRTTEGLCVTPASLSTCKTECPSGSGSFDESLGLCICSETLDEDVICNATCRAQMTEISIVPADLDLGETEPWIQVSSNYDDSTVAKVNIHGLPGYLGDISCSPDSGETSCPTQVIKVTNATFQGVYNPTVAYLTTFISDLIVTGAEYIPDDSYLPQPMVCVELGETVLFDVSDGQYPVYDKDSLHNTDTNFDYGMFRSLDARLSASLNVTLFGFTFTTDGVHVFSSNANSARKLMISVMPENTRCPTEARIVASTSSNMVALGVRRSDSILLSPDWVLVLLLLLGVLVAAGVVVVGMCIFQRRQWARVKGKPPAYRTVGQHHDFAQYSRKFRNAMIDAGNEFEMEWKDDDWIVDLEGFNVKTFFEKLAEQRNQMKNLLGDHDEKLDDFCDKLQKDSDLLRNIVTAKVDALPNRVSGAVAKEMAKRMQQLLELNGQDASKRKKMMKEFSVIINNLNNDFIKEQKEGSKHTENVTNVMNDSDKILNELNKLLADLLSDPSDEKAMSAARKLLAQLNSHENNLREEINHEEERRKYGMLSQTGKVYILDPTTGFAMKQALMGPDTTLKIVPGITRRDLATKFVGPVPGVQLVRENGDLLPCPSDMIVNPNDFSVVPIVGSVAIDTATSQPVFYDSPNLPVNAKLIPYIPPPIHPTKGGCVSAINHPPESIKCLSLGDMMTCPTSGNKVPVIGATIDPSTNSAVALGGMHVDPVTGLDIPIVLHEPMRDPVSGAIVPIMNITIQAPHGEIKPIGGLAKSVRSGEYVPIRVGAKFIDPLSGDKIVATTARFDQDVGHGVPAEDHHLLSLYMRQLASESTYTDNIQRVSNELGGILNGISTAQTFYESSNDPINGMTELNNTLLELRSRLDDVSSQNGTERRLAENDHNQASQQLKVLNMGNALHLNKVLENAKNVAKTGGIEGEIIDPLTNEKVDLLVGGQMVDYTTGKTATIIDIITDPATGVKKPVLSTDTKTRGKEGENDEQKKQQAMHDRNGLEQETLMRENASRDMKRLENELESLYGQFEEQLELLNKNEDSMELGNIEDNIAAIVAQIEKLTEDYNRTQQDEIARRNGTNYNDAIHDDSIRELVTATDDTYKNQLDEVRGSIGGVLAMTRDALNDLHESRRAAGEMQSQLLERGQQAAAVAHEHEFVLAMNGMAETLLDRLKGSRDGVRDALTDSLVTRENQTFNIDHASQLLGEILQQLSEHTEVEHDYGPTLSTLPVLPSQASQEAVDLMEFADVLREMIDEGGLKDLINNRIDEMKRQNEILARGSTGGVPVETDIVTDVGGLDLPSVVESDLPTITSVNIPVVSDVIEHSMEDLKQRQTDEIDNTKKQIDDTLNSALQIISSKFDAQIQGLRDVLSEAHRNNDHETANNVEEQISALVDRKKEEIDKIKLRMEEETQQVLNQLGNKHKNEETELQLKIEQQNERQTLNNEFVSEFNDIEKEFEQSENLKLEGINGKIDTDLDIAKRQAQKKFENLLKKEKNKNVRDQLMNDYQRQLKMLEDRYNSERNRQVLDAKSKLQEAKLKRQQKLREQQERRQRKLLEEQQSKIESQIEQTTNDIKNTMFNDNQLVEMQKQLDHDLNILGNDIKKKSNEMEEILEKEEDKKEDEIENEFEAIKNSEIEKLAQERNRVLSMVDGNDEETRQRILADFDKESELLTNKLNQQRDIKLAEMRAELQRNRLARKQAMLEKVEGKRSDQIEKARDAVNKLMSIKAKKGEDISTSDIANIQEQQRQEQEKKFEEEQSHLTEVLAETEKLAELELVAEIETENHSIEQSLIDQRRSALEQAITAQDKEEIMNEFDEKLNNLHMQVETNRLSQLKKARQEAARRRRERQQKLLEEQEKERSDLLKQQENQLVEVANHCETVTNDDVNKLREAAETAMKVNEELVKVKIENENKLDDINQQLDIEEQEEMIETEQQLEKLDKELKDQLEEERMKLAQVENMSEAEKLQMLQEFENNRSQLSSILDNERDKQRSMMRKAAEARRKQRIIAQERAKQAEIAKAKEEAESMKKKTQVEFSEAQLKNLIEKGIDGLPVEQMQNKIEEILSEQHAKEAYLMSMRHMHEKVDTLADSVNSVDSKFHKARSDLFTQSAERSRDVINRLAKKEISVEEAANLQQKYAQALDEELKKLEDELQKERETVQKQALESLAVKHSQEKENFKRKCYRQIQDVCESYVPSVKLLKVKESEIAAEHRKYIEDLESEKSKALRQLEEEQKQQREVASKKYEEELKALEQELQLKAQKDEENIKRALDRLQTNQKEEQKKKRQTFIKNLAASGLSDEDQNAMIKEHEDNMSRLAERQAIERQKQLTEMRRLLNDRKEKVRAKRRRALNEKLAIENASRRAEMQQKKVELQNKVHTAVASHREETRKKELVELRKKTAEMAKQKQEEQKEVEQTVEAAPAPVVPSGQPTANIDPAFVTTLMERLTQIESKLDGGVRQRPVSSSQLSDVYIDLVEQKLRLEGMLSTIDTEDLPPSEKKVYDFVENLVDVICAKNNVSKRPTLVVASSLPSHEFGRNSYGRSYHCDPERNSNIYIRRIRLAEPGQAAAVVCRALTHFILGADGGSDLHPEYHHTITKVQTDVMGLNVFDDEDDEKDNTEKEEETVAPTDIETELNELDVLSRELDAFSEMLGDDVISNDRIALELKNTEIELSSIQDDKSQLSNSIKELYRHVHNHDDQSQGKTMISNIERVVGAELANIPEEEKAARILAAKLAAFSAASRKEIELSSQKRRMSMAMSPMARSRTSSKSSPFKPNDTLSDLNAMK
ncbi:hypothetical protein PCE1_003639 [Barthelona sp. PCE]